MQDGVEWATVTDWMIEAEEKVVKDLTMRAVKEETDRLVNFSADVALQLSVLQRKEICVEVQQIVTARCARYTAALKELLRSSADLTPANGEFTQQEWLQLFGGEAGVLKQEESRLTAARFELEAVRQVSLYSTFGIVWCDAWVLHGAHSFCCCRCPQVQLRNLYKQRHSPLRDRRLWFLRAVDSCL